MQDGIEKRDVEWRRGEGKKAKSREIKIRRIN